MPWCLPDRNPLFWDDMRRRFLGKGKFRFWRMIAALVCFCLLAGILLHASLQAVKQGGASDMWRLWTVLQSLVIVLFGPMAAVNVISGERERGSLELLFLTPVSSRSLMLQKFCAAAALLSLVLITFLPATIASCCSGAVSPLHFLLDYLMLAAQIACTISIGMLASCFIHQTRNASAASFVLTILLAYILYAVLLPRLPGVIALIIAPDTVTFTRDGLPIINGSAPDLWNYALTYYMPLFLLIALLCLHASTRMIERQRNSGRMKREALHEKRMAHS